MPSKIASSTRALVRGALPEPVRRVIRFLRQPERFAHFGPPFQFHKDGMATIHRPVFASDAAFVAAFGESMRDGAWNGSWGHAEPEWRQYIACWAAAQVKHLDGDYAECGVYRGGLARTVMRYIGFEQMVDRTFWLLDTFEGIPDSQLDAGVTHRHRYPDTWAEVSRLFGDRRNVRLVRGRVPDTLSQVLSDRFCFLSIDMNVAAPEIAALEFFWPRLVAGGMVLIDDYGWNGHDPQQRGFDDFARRHDRAVLALPTGQGLLIK